MSKERELGAATKKNF